MAVGIAARVDALSVRDFRNLERLELELPPAGMLIVGENGQGKTNFLEAIYYLQVLRSMRGARDQDLVRFGAPGFHVGAQIAGDRASEIGVGFDKSGKRKRVRLDGVVSERLSDAVGALPVAMFSPADVDLVAGGPATRRRFLDIMLAVTSRGYLRALQHYRAALVRRNAALRDAARRSAARAEERVAVWEAPLAEHGAVLWAEREAWVESVAEQFTALARDIGGDELALRYASWARVSAARSDRQRDLAHALEQHRATDIRFGLTRAGPHRDDLLITIRGADAAARDLRVFGSAGQQRTAAIALRLLEASRLQERRGGPPIVLLDDPFAELDVPRTQRIVRLLSETGLGQTILAVPRESDVPGGMPHLQRFRIMNGVLARD
ncbi:MAG TPA: DNA replication and repair protein RecF [Gemmatimonadaceae bacterium]